MRVRVQVDMRRGQFEVEMEAPEVWDSATNEATVAKTLDQAVQAVKRAVGVR